MCVRLMGSAWIKLNVHLNFWAPNWTKKILDSIQGTLFDSSEYAADYAGTLNIQGYITDCTICTIESVWANLPNVHYIRPVH